MRIIFMGTPLFAVPTLAALHGAKQGAEHEIIAIYSQPPRRAHRGKALQPGAVHQWASQHGLNIYTPQSLKSAEEQARFAAMKADIVVVAAYGLILPPAILAAARYGCLNVHGSLLPRWRGAAPVQRAILAGDHETGVTIMQMDSGLDTGNIVASARTAIATKTAGELTNELAQMGAALMLRTVAEIPAFAAGSQSATFAAGSQNDEQAIYAAKVTAREVRLDFSAEALQVERVVRAFNPVPGAFFELDGERYKVLAAQVIQALDAQRSEQTGSEPSDDTSRNTAVESGTIIDDRLTIACGSGAIRLLCVQRAGKRAMSADAMLRGRPIAAGIRLV